MTTKQFKYTVQKFDAANRTAEVVFSDGSWAVVPLVPFPSVNSFHDDLDALVRPYAPSAQELAIRETEVSNAAAAKLLQMVGIERGTDALDVRGGVVNNPEALLITPEKSLDELKADKNEQINAARMAANLSTFPFMGKRIQCDELSRGDIDAIQGKVARTGELPGNFPGAWKTLDNDYVAIPDAATWDAFYDAMIDQGTANFQKAQALKAQLAGAQTLEEVAAIAW